MKKSKATKTELIFILDKSGSMEGLEKDTIGGFNSLIRKQRGEEGQVRVTTVLFDDNYEVLHDRFDLEEVKPLTEKEYFVEGCTALLDAMGRAIKDIKKVQKNCQKENRADRVMFVIITDGRENASMKYRSDEVKRMISRQKEKGWEFLFLGANIDAVETAAQFGIGNDRAVDYLADSRGTALNFSEVSKAVSTLRKSAPLTAQWKKKIEEDYKSRSHSR